jgi:DNA-directed RNA polymerase specialized sigma24 family protein
MQRGKTDDLLALDAALARFAEVYPEKAQLVRLRYFAGLTAGQAAAVMGLSCSTADRYWGFSKAWLFRAMVS